MSTDGERRPDSYAETAAWLVPACSASACWVSPAWRREIRIKCLEYRSDAMSEVYRYRYERPAVTVCRIQCHCREEGSSVPDIPETHHDLLNAPFATLATVGASGRPQLSTVYFLASADGTVQLSVNATRQKAKNIVANPKVALHIQDTVEYVRYLELRGDATVEPRR